MCFEQREWHNTSSESGMSKQMAEVKRRKRRRRGADWLAHSHLESWSWGVYPGCQIPPCSSICCPQLCFFAGFVAISPSSSPKYSFTKSWECGAGSGDVSLAEN